MSVKETTDFSQESVQLLINFLRENCLERKWLRTGEVAKYLGISQSQVHNLKREGILPFSKLNGTIYINKDDIDVILEQNKQDSH